jgi:DNA-directed RNA polymerase subunit RPC12/RpoP
MSIVNDDRRFIIRAKSPEYVEAIKRLYNSKMARAQIHKVLEITDGDIVGLKIALRDENNSIWFNYKGRRYDINQSGAVMSETKFGKIIKVPANQSRKIKCPLCGTENEIPQNIMRAKCSNCGFKILRFKINVRTK